MDAETKIKVEILSPEQIKDLVETVEKFRAALDASEREVEGLKSLQPGDTWRFCGHIAPGTCWTCYVARGQALATAEARLAEVEKELEDLRELLNRAEDYMTHAPICIYPVGPCDCDCNDTRQEIVRALSPEAQDRGDARALGNTREERMR